MKKEEEKVIGKLMEKQEQPKELMELMKTEEEYGLATVCIMMRR